MEAGFTRRRAAPTESFSDESEAPRRPRLALWIGIAVALVALVGGWAFFHHRKGAAVQTGAGKPVAAPSVTFIVPGRTATTSAVSATGSLGARREMPVGVAGEGGMVTRVLVDAGDWVKPGQVLATIERSVQVQEAASLSASIAAAQADADIAQSNLDRARQLVGRGFISKADMDQKTATRDAALARVKVAQAQLGQQRAQIGRLDVRAPAGGLVLARAVEAGQVVGAGTLPLFRIAKDGELELRAQVAEQDLAGLGVGRPAQVTPVGGTRTFPGTIWQMPPVVDPNSRQGIVKIALKYDPALRPGGFASASITSGAVDAPLLPESAVQNDDKGSFVYVIGPDSRVQRRYLKEGEVSDRGIAVLGGLDGHERVVLSAGAFLNPGDKVTPIRAAAR